MRTPSGGRAAFAVLTLPLATITVVVGLYAWFIATVLSTAGAGFAPGGGMMFGGTTFAHNETHAMVSTYLDYSREHGALPAHPLQLLLDDRAYSTEFVSSDSMTTTDQIIWPTLEMTDLDHMTESGRESRIAAFVEQLPEDAIAYRVGDYVFTCPGIDPSTLTPDVWLVIQSPMPATGPAPTGFPQSGFPLMVHVGLADGSVLAIPKQTFQNSLQGQFTVRKNNNLPLLPKLESITHAQPALRDAADVED